jgi:transcription antitermination factor NusG
MDYKNWYALSINMNKENATKSELLARKEVFQDRFLEDVEYLKRKEICIEKSGKRVVKNKLLMSGYLLVKVKQQEVEDEEGNKSYIFPPDTFDLIVGTPGIKFFVNCEKDHPIPFRPREIKKLFDMCDDAHLEVKQNMQNDFQEGDVLDVIDGPFTGYKCEVSSVQGQKILGQIDMFGRLVPAEFTFDQVYKNV